MPQVVEKSLFLFYTKPPSFSAVCFVFLKYSKVSRRRIKDEYWLGRPLSKAASRATSTLHTASSSFRTYPTGTVSQIKLCVKNKKKLVKAPLQHLHVFELESIPIYLSSRVFFGKLFPSCQFLLSSPREKD